MSKFRVVEFENGKLGIEKREFFGLLSVGFVGYDELHAMSRSPYLWASETYIEKNAQIQPRFLERAKEYCNLLNTTYYTSTKIKRVIE
jgi:hypothetical protein